jgi:hypothetical protein
MPARQQLTCVGPAAGQRGGVIIAVAAAEEAEAALGAAGDTQPRHSEQQRWRIWLLLSHVRGQVSDWMHRQQWQQGDG